MMGHIGTVVAAVGVGTRTTPGSVSSARKRILLDAVLATPIQ